jgi:hypothetical protein
MRICGVSAIMASGSKECGAQLVEQPSVAERKRERETGPAGSIDLRGENQLELTTSRRHSVGGRLLSGSEIDRPQLDKGRCGRATFGTGVLLGEVGAKPTQVEAKLTGNGRDGVVLE